MESVFELLAEPNRRAILSLLVASERSVGEIERRLHMAQPTVSTHIRKLSETLGVPLIRHSGRSIEVTRAGEEVYTACQDVYGRLLETERRIAPLRVTVRPQVRIAVAASAKPLVAGLLAQCWEINTDFDVTLTVIDDAALPLSLAADEMDFHLVAEPPADPCLVRTPLPGGQAGCLVWRASARPGTAAANWLARLRATA